MLLPPPPPPLPPAARALFVSHLLPPRVLFLSTTSFFPLNRLSRVPRDFAVVVVSLFLSLPPPPALPAPPLPPSLARPFPLQKFVLFVARGRERPTSVNQFQTVSLARLFSTFRVTANARRLE